MIYILVLNWNGVEDTIQCLESLFILKNIQYKIVICDNASSDNSVELINAFLKRKKIAFSIITEKKAGILSDTLNDKVVIIENSKNLGFAAGNNVGLQYILKDKHFEYVWLLNNDTVVDCMAGDVLNKKMKGNSNIGICGSTLLYYNMPNKLQGCGGAKYNKWLGLSTPIGQYMDYNSVNLKNKEFDDMDYIIGASMFTTKEFLLKVGLMSESYFLYYEELDWFMRAKYINKNYVLGYAPESIVYHKEGASAGSNICQAKRSLVSDYYGIKNRLIFTKKYFWYALPTVYFSVILSAFLRIKRHQWKHFFQIVKILFCERK